MTTRHVWLAVATLAVGAWAAVANAQSTVHLYIYDTHTGAVTQATGPMDRDPYNASFSNNGKMLVHDLTDTVTFDKQLLGVTDLATGTTKSLNLFGDNAVWSPNGRLIAYFNFTDWVDSGFDPAVPPEVRVVPAEGGAPVAVRKWASDASWSNNSRRIAFVDWWPQYIGTIGLDGTGETLFNEAVLGTGDGIGCNPSYSPDGKLIVYESRECAEGGGFARLMVIPVNARGEPLGPPYAITDGTFWAVQPSFSNDGKTIVFSAGIADPMKGGLYTVSVYGGDPVLVLDRPDRGEWDPAYSKNGRYIVFSGEE
jgi:Tol biopolymer transport system component